MKRAYLFMGLFLVVWGTLVVQVLSGPKEFDIPPYLQNNQPQAAKPAFTSPSPAPSSVVSEPRHAGASILHHSGAAAPALQEFATRPPVSPSVSGYRLYTSSSRSVQSVGGGGGGGIATTMGSTSSMLGASSSSSFASSAALIAMATPAPSYSSPVSLTARSVQGGTTSEQTYARFSPRRAIITGGDEDDGYGDENLHPTNPPADPYFTPLGDAPWLLILALAAIYTLIIVLRKKTQASVVINN